MSSKQIDNKIEKLIPVFRSNSQLKELIDEDSVNQLGDYTDKDKELLEEFKKIYHLGRKQLIKFIDKLEELGEDIDETSIIYYKNRLLNGPLRSLVLELTRDKNFWRIYSDINGIFGNDSMSSNTDPIWACTNVDIPVDLYNKMPGFMISNIQEQVLTTGEIIHSATTPIIKNDNTLPMIDKSPTDRMMKEYSTGRNLDAHANNIVMDIEYGIDLSAISERIFKKVEEFLLEDYKLYEYTKTANPFTASSNTANYVIGRKVVVNDGEVVKLDTDLTGRQFDSFERMKYELELNLDEKNTKFKLRSIKGQLGSGEPVKTDPITDV